MTKAAIEPVWFLPGIADRFKVDESTLRRSLFETMGGMYPDLVTRPDLKTFLPPIGGMTVYFFGDVEKLAEKKIKCLKCGSPQVRRQLGAFFAKTVRRS